MESIDSTLFANQIGTYGVETMKKIVNLSVFIYGMRGLGVEIAKNIILSGARIVTIYDNSTVIPSDLNLNFFLLPSDVGKTTRAEGSLKKLQQLNSNASVKVFNGELSNNFQVLNDYSVVIISELINLDMAETLDDYCRNEKKGFIYSVCLGLTGFAFVDFGEEFVVFDNNGEEPKQYFVRNISNACPGVVLIDNNIDKKPLDLSSGDFVTFKEVSGMSELNDTPPRPIRILTPTSFTIEDTSKFQEYNCSGTIEEVKIPRPMSFRPLREALNHIYREERLNEDNEDVIEEKDEQIDIKENYNDKKIVIKKEEGKHKYTCDQIDLSKKNQNEKLHLGFLAIHEFLLKTNHLPHLNNQDDCNQCVTYGKEIYDKAKTNNYLWVNNLASFDNEFIYNMARWARAQIPPICSFLGGIIGQEIVKFTGKYSPLNQWLWFDFFECVKPTMEFEVNHIQLPKRASSEPRYNEQVAILNEKVNNTLINFNILLIGCGAVGNELLKIFSLMGISSGKGVLTIADDDIIEKSNLNPQFLYNSNDVGQIKGKKCREALLKHNPDLHIEFLGLKINEANDKIIKDDFWLKQDIVICAVDNYQSRRYVDFKCKWFKRILINIGTLTTKGHCQTIIPGFTSCYTDDYIPDQAHKVIIEYPTTIEHCIEWAREIFNKSFSTEIKEINLLLQSNESNIKGIFDSFNNQREYNIETIFKIDRYRTLLTINESKDFGQLIRYSIEKFQELFDESIQDLLLKYPSDASNEDGTKFWSGAKRQPQNIRYDVKDQKHFLFVSTFSILLAHCLKLQVIDEFKTIKDIVANYPIKDYLFYKKNKMKEDYQKQVNDFFSFVQKYKSKEPLAELIFDKQNDSNQHVTLVMAAANVRAQNYKLNECDMIKAKICSGKSMPSVGTATASISGIAAIQILSLSQYDDLNSITSTDHLRNCFMNQGINLILITELFPKKIHCNKMNGSITETKAIPINWQTWDEIKLTKSMTLEEFIDYFMNQYQVKVAKVYDGHKVLSSFNEEELNKKLEILFEAENKKQITLEVTGVTTNNEKISMPFISYSIANS